MAKHNIVYSVKGGSGKSTIALFLQLREIQSFSGDGCCDYTKVYHWLIKNELKANLDDLDKVSAIRLDGDDYQKYLVDLDFAGSTLKNFLEILKVNEGRRGKSSLVKYICEGKKLEDLLYTLTDETPANANIIVSSDDEKEKEVFKIKQRQNFILKFNLFKVMINKLIGDIKNHSGEEKRAIITYDLPPNADGYVDILLRLLLSKEGRTENGKGGPKEEEVNLFLVTKPDQTAISAHAEWLKRFMQSCSRHPKRIFWILNDVRQYDQDKINTYGRLLGAIKGHLDETSKNYKHADLENYIGVVFNNQSLNDLIMNYVAEGTNIENIKNDQQSFNVWRIR